MSKDIMEFIVYIIHACANQKNVSPAKVYEKLKKSGCIHDYLMPHYKVLHTQSSRYIADDIQQYLMKRGMTL